MSIECIKNYISSTVKTPYFVFVGDSRYETVLKSLSELELDIVPMSNFCSDFDKMPEIDSLINYIDSADVNAKGKKFVVTGLGEFLALRGKEEANRAISQMKSLNIGGAKVILLLRGIAYLIDELSADPRFESRCLCVIGNTQCDISIILSTTNIKSHTLSGYKALLAELERGKNGSISTSSEIDFSKSLFTVNIISDAYESITYNDKNFTVEKSCGNDENWEKLRCELIKYNNSIKDVFINNGITDEIETDVYERLLSNDFQSWLYFIALKNKSDIIENDYLKLVLDKTNRYEEFSFNILNAIIDISHKDIRFSTFYNQRKKMIEKASEPEMEQFVLNNRQNTEESIYKLTNNTRVEREEIVAWVSKNGMISLVETIYPTLTIYCKKYIFKHSDLTDLLTDYFDSYKHQKLANKLEPEFVEKVDKLATPPRIFNRLPTREELIDKIDINDTLLYWLDALGVEYLSLIEYLAHKRKLAININIARAELPTITSINRKFYDTWQGGKKKDDSLDDTKHREKGGYNFSDNTLPIHLAKELDIISEVIDKIATILYKREKYTRVLLVSDHGASRLAVLRRKEEKYDTDTSGEHSGRCCRIFEPYDLPFAAQENGYLVLADYGRFKGSRKANVEVHGGASLEEVIIPVIEFSLLDDSITVKLVKETVKADRKEGIRFDLFFDTHVNNVSVVINNKSYNATKTDANHFNVIISDIKRAGTYCIDVYSGDNLAGMVTLKVESKSGMSDDSFDSLFNF